MSNSEHTLIPELIAGGSTIIAAILAIIGGIWFYYRQKEYELVQKRYLEEGLDVLIATTENALTTFHHNWARILEILKVFRDLDKVKPEELSSGFINLPPDRFVLTANYRVNQIVDDPVIWKIFQLVISFSQSSCSIITEEIPLALKAKITTSDVTASRAEMVEEATKLLTDLNEKSNKYHFFIGKLQDISMLLEQQKFSLKDMRELKKHPVVLEAIGALKEHYKDELSQA